MNREQLKVLWDNTPYRIHKFDEVFSKKSHYQRGKIKKFLLKTTFLDNVCSVCGISEWMGDSISLHLDHIDGDCHNNQLDNFRLLCPNCHSQTPTYSRRKSDTLIKEKRTESDFVEAIKDSENARQALIKLGLQAFGGNYDRVRKVQHKKKVEFKPRTSKIPPMDELLDKVSKYSFTEVGEQYGVSDNSVRKWLKKYGVPCSRKGLKEFLVDSGLEYTVKWRVATEGIKGESNKTSKLTEESVREIRKLSSDGWSQRNLAKLFGVTHCTIRNVINGTSWTHVT